ncbi:MAG: protein-glutamate O-methyltransferase CheR [Candidatus Melainabacteria bacterium]
MTLSLTAPEFDLFRDLIEKECGISVHNDKMYLIETRLMKLVLENGCENFGEFYHKAKHDNPLKDKIVDAMTTNETLWFRDNTPYIALKEYLFPMMVEQMKSGQRSELNIWSAACSTGQEPYSIAMLAHEYARQTGNKELISGRMNIFATDISPSALMIAKIGRYDPLSMSRGMTEELRGRYFEEQNKVAVIKPEIKNMVKFQQMNLLKPFENIGRYDVVLLRNVAIYFSEEFKINLFKRITQVMKPNGYLFLGASETLFAYSQDFKNVEFANARFYQLNI